jgi:hypothetical protein
LLCAALLPLTFLSVTAGASLIGATAADAAALSCPGGSYNLCIPAQGANEGVTGTAGSVVMAGYEFKVPGPDTTTVMVLNAYEQLTVSCANGATPTQPTISVPMPDASYTAPFQQSQGLVPSGNQSSLLTYEGSFTLPDLCNGGTIRVGQPGQMLFAAQVESNGTSSLNFQSHYNDGSLSKSGGWSATVSVQPTPTWSIDQWGTPQPTDDAVLKWDEQVMGAIRAYPKQTGPTIASRAYGVLFTAMYDAWAPYDPVAKVTQNDGPSRQTTGDTDANKTEAMSYAAYRTLTDLFPPAQFPCVPVTCPTDGTAAYLTPDFLLRSQGFDPSYTTPASPTDTAASPAAVGNLAAQSVLDFRHNDGSNQLNGYADTTGYQPVNSWNQVNDRWRWQPLCVPLPPPGATSCDSPSAVQKPLTPQWGNIIPFSEPSAFYNLPGPPKNPDGSYSTADIVTSLAVTSNLNDTEKVTAEYWADGPGTAFPPGHMLLFAEALSRKNHYSLDTDVKLFFTLGNAEMDAGIMCWYYKYKYDFVRPVTAIRTLYYNQPVTSWLGPNQGYGTVLGQDWIPYQQLSVVTPPFPEYPSGHSTFTAAAAAILAAFTGSDTFGVTVTVPAHSSKFESNTPATAITLSFPTFTAAANDAGISREYGGIHFHSGDFDGRSLGRQVGQSVWSTAQDYIQGRIGKPGS